MIAFETERDTGGVVVVRCRGRLDMPAVPALRALLGEVLDSGTSLVVLDLADTSFLDSSGLGGLIAGLKRAQAAGADLRLAAAQEQVRMVLELTRLETLLPPYVDVAAALHDR